ncbi:MAG: NAD(P)-dependent oxidoreductase, partial [Sphaerochaetaceae bacterium]|nr:NAD(P)-dependent oxidoreductase [Sphaerochaetaceae bacterium]
IDMEYAKQKGVVVKNAVGYSTASVVQVTFSFALHFIQHLDFYKKYVDDGKWQNSEIFTNIDKPFNELANKKWGVIGLGNIGKSVASVASAFGCEVSYYSTSGANNNTNYKSITLEELLKSSDIISIHCPLNNTTKNLLNSTNMNLIKEKAIVLNLGRGGIIDEDAILDIIDSKEVYFGIDTVIKEPIEASSPLLKVKNKDRLLLTPHIGWASIESRERLIQCLVDNISEFVL